MRYDYRCEKCGHVVELNVPMAKRDEVTETCKNMVPYAGAALEGVVGDDGKLEVTAVSLVPLGTQADPHAVMKVVCGGTLKREEIALTAKMGHQWMP